MADDDHEQLENTRGRRICANESAVRQPKYGVDLLGAHGREGLLNF